MLYKEIMAVCSEIHTKHINTQCGQNVEFVNVKAGGTYSNHWTAGCVKRFKQYDWPELCLNTQSVPRCKHTPSLL
jgi:hypothetical protein